MTKPLIAKFFTYDGASAWKGTSPVVLPSYTYINRKYWEGAQNTQGATVTSTRDRVPVWQVPTRVRGGFSLTDFKVLPDGSVALVSGSGVEVSDTFAVLDGESSRGGGEILTERDRVFSDFTTVIAEGFDMAYVDSIDGITVGSTFRIGLEPQDRVVTSIGEKGGRPYITFSPQRSTELLVGSALVFVSEASVVTTTWEQEFGGIPDGVVYVEHHRNIDVSVGDYVDITPRGSSTSSRHTITSLRETRRNGEYWNINPTYRWVRRETVEFHHNIPGSTRVLFITKQQDVYDTVYIDSSAPLAIGGVFYIGQDPQARTITNINTDILGRNYVDFSPSAINPIPTNTTLHFSHPSSAHAYNLLYTTSFDGTINEGNTLEFRPILRRSPIDNTLIGTPKIYTDTSIEFLPEDSLTSSPEYFSEVDPFSLLFEVPETLRLFFLENLEERAEMYVLFQGDLGHSFDIGQEHVPLFKVRLSSFTQHVLQNGNFSLMFLLDAIK